MASFVPTGAFGLQMAVTQKQTRQLVKSCENILLIIS